MKRTPAIIAISIPEKVVVETALKGTDKGLNRIKTI